MSLVKLRVCWVVLAVPLPATLETIHYWSWCTAVNPHPSVCATWILCKKQVGQWIFCSLWAGNWRTFVCFSTWLWLYMSSQSQELNSQLPLLSLSANKSLHVLVVTWLSIKLFSLWPFYRHSSCSSCLPAAVSSLHLTRGPSHRLLKSWIHKRWVILRTVIKDIVLELHV